MTRKPVGLEDSCGNVFEVLGFDERAAASLTYQPDLRGTLPHEKRSVW